MTATRQLAGLGPAAVARMLIAASVAAGSFAAFRSIYHGWCLIPTHDGEFFRFLALPAVFALAFIWLTAELLEPIRASFDLRKVFGRAPSLVWAVFIYFIIGFGVLMAGPAPDHNDPAGLVMFNSAFWSIGVLQETGNFSSELCGY